MDHPIEQTLWKVVLNLKRQHTTIQQWIGGDNQTVQNTTLQHPQWFIMPNRVNKSHQIHRYSTNSLTSKVGLHTYDEVQIRCSNINRFGLLDIFIGQFEPWCFLFECNIWKNSLPLLSTKWNSSLKYYPFNYLPTWRFILFKYFLCSFSKILRFFRKILYINTCTSKILAAGLERRVARCPVFDRTVRFFGDLSGQKYDA